MLLTVSENAILSESISLYEIIDAETITGATLSRGVTLLARIIPPPGRSPGRNVILSWLLTDVTGCSLFSVTLRLRRPSGEQ